MHVYSAFLLHRGVHGTILGGVYSDDALVENVFGDFGGQNENLEKIFRPES